MSSMQESSELQNRAVADKDDHVHLILKDLLMVLHSKAEKVRTIR